MGAFAGAAARLRQARRWRARYSGSHIEGQETRGQCTRRDRGELAVSVERPADRAKETGHVVNTRRTASSSNWAAVAGTQSDQRRIPLEDKFYLDRSLRST